MHDFFLIIKANDTIINFVFITGVSAFSQAGLFSGLNNLQNITLDRNFATICGYTDEEIDHYFTMHIQTWAEQQNISYVTLRQQIKEWYNGYQFGKNVSSVYNPFSLMNALSQKDFINFWFRSGTPTFLIEVLKKEYRTFDPQQLETSADLLGTFDVGATPLIALMFQTGYLTITAYDPHTRLYKLDYPNFEVKTALQKYLLEAFAHIDATSAERISLSTTYKARKLLSCFVANGFRHNRH